MSDKKHKTKAIQKKIARNRIKQLFTMAEKSALSGKLSLANRYVEIARKISMRHLVSIPDESKRRFCKHCYHYLLPGINCRVRIHRGKIVIFCSDCKKNSRFIISR